MTDPEDIISPGTDMYDAPSPSPAVVRKGKKAREGPSPAPKGPSAALAAAAPKPKAAAAPKAAKVRFRSAAYLVWLVQSCEVHVEPASAAGSWAWELMSLYVCEPCHNHNGCSYISVLTCDMCVAAELQKAAEPAPSAAPAAAAAPAERNRRAAATTAPKRYVESDDEEDDESIELSDSDDYCPSD